MPDASTATPRHDWLSLGPASRLLGVDPDTLRRWADAGRIDAWTTPGGHRRFERRSVERLAATRRGDRLLLSVLGATPERISRAYRRSYQTDPARQPARELENVEREAFRVDGRRLVEALLAYLDAADRVAEDRAEADAVGLVDELARRLKAAGTSLTDSVELFVAARRPFLTELGAVGRRRALDAARLANAYDRASALLDRLLLRLIATHQAL